MFWLFSKMISVMILWPVDADDDGDGVVNDDTERYVTWGDGIYVLGYLTWGRVSRGVASQLNTATLKSNHWPGTAKPSTSASESFSWFSISSSSASESSSWFSTSSSSATAWQGTLWSCQRWLVDVEQWEGRQLSLCPSARSTPEAGTLLLLFLLDSICLILLFDLLPYNSLIIPSWSWVLHGRITSISTNISRLSSWS